ncbi:MAG: winged helix-turn-helix transcriptional regulator [SAR324 cluster bacterium]|nr:winged helix-turn-helix transcriptional regulator [SAR324 cluster bacterium]
MQQLPQLDSSVKKELEELFINQEESVEQTVRGIKVLAHPARLKILCALRAGEQTVQNLEKYTGIVQATLSQHLSLLKDRGMVKARREGNFSIYSLANGEVMEIFSLIQRMYCH